MKKQMMLGAMGFAILALAAQNAAAQTARNCAPRDVVVERLANKYGEAQARQTGPAPDPRETAQA